MDRRRPFPGSEKRQGRKGVQLDAEKRTGNGWRPDRDERYADREEEIDRGPNSLDKMGAGSLITLHHLIDPSKDQIMTSKPFIARSADEASADVIKPTDGVEVVTKMVTCYSYVTVFHLV